MWTAYDLFRRQEFTDFGAMRQALEAELGDLGSFGSSFKGPKAGAKPGAKPASSAAADEDDEADGDEDEDFDDHE